MTEWQDLHASAFVLTIRPGMISEYRRRHDAIWPEMRAALLAEGVVHYDIHLHERDRRVYGHILRRCEPPPAGHEDPVILTWRRYMADVLEMDGEEPARLPITRVFRLTA